MNRCLAPLASDAPPDKFEPDGFRHQRYSSRVGISGVTDRRQYQWILPRTCASWTHSGDRLRPSDAVPFTRVPRQSHLPADQRNPSYLRLQDLHCQALPFGRERRNLLAIGKCKYSTLPLFSWKLSHLSKPPPCHVEPLPAAHPIVLFPPRVFPKCASSVRESVRESAWWAARSGESLFFRRVLFWRKGVAQSNHSFGWRGADGCRAPWIFFIYLFFFMNSCWTRELCAMGFAEIWGLYNSRGLSLFLRVRVDFVRAGHTRKCPLLFQMGASMCSDLFISFYFLSWHKTATTTPPPPLALLFNFTLHPFAEHVVIAAPHGGHYKFIKRTWSAEAIWTWIM